MWKKGNSTNYVNLTNQLGCFGATKFRATKTFAVIIGTSGYTAVFVSVYIILAQDPSTIDEYTTTFYTQETSTLTSLPRKIANKYHNVNQA